MATDRHPLVADEFDRNIRLLRCSRSSLVEAVGAMSSYEWDTARPGERTIRAILQHVADSETLMLARLGVEPTFRSHTDPLTALARVRAMFEFAVTSVFDDVQAGEIELVNGVWSLPKVLRMAVWHDRHTTVQLAARSNPAAYMKTLASEMAVVRTRYVTDRSGDSQGAVEEQTVSSKHTHASGYYY